MRVSPRSLVLDGLYLYLTCYILLVKVSNCDNAHQACNADTCTALTISHYNEVNFDDLQPQ